MTNIQQGIRFHMPVQISGFALADVEKIEFLFKRTASSAAAPIKSAVWKADGTGSAVTDPDAPGGDRILIAWTREETYLFPAGQRFYMHARIHYADAEDEPFVPIQTLVMGPSLFSARDVDAEEGEA